MDVSARLKVLVLTAKRLLKRWRLCPVCCSGAAADAASIVDLAEAATHWGLDSLTDAQIDYMLENNMTLDDVQLNLALKNSAGPVQTKASKAGLLGLCA